MWVADLELTVYVVVLSTRQVLLEFVRRSPVSAVHMTGELCDAVVSPTVSAYRRREALTMRHTIWKSKGAVTS